MKQITWMTVLFVATCTQLFAQQAVRNKPISSQAPLSSSSASSPLRESPTKASFVCRKADTNMACDAADVQGMNMAINEKGHSGNNAVATKARMHKPYAHSVEMLSTDGSMRCVQNDGSSCTSDQVTELLSMSFQKITLSSPLSSGAVDQVVSPRDLSSGQASGK